MGSAVTIVTLIAKALRQDHVRAAAAVLGDAVESDWLGEGEACDLLAASPAGVDEARIAEALAGAGVDFFVQPAGHRAGVPERRKKLLVADMDSTIIEVECIDEMADMLGMKAEIAAITERTMRGELDFATALRQRARMLSGLEQAQLQEVYDERISLSPGARTLVMTMRAHGAVTALVSGGFRFFTQRVRADAGFDSDQANTLEFADGRLTGTVTEPVVGPEAKRAVLEQLAAKGGFTPAEALAVGDGANDMMMLETAGLGVAYRAKPALAAIADARIEHADLTALLYLQGIRREDFSQ